MKLVINLKLVPDAEQRKALKETLERCNAACNWLSGLAFESKIFGQFSLHKAHYYAMREKFGLTAQVAVRCIAKVADTYKLKNRRTVKREFRKWSAQPYDDRIFRFAKGDKINLWTLAGRQTIAFECGKYQRDLLPFRKGEVDIMLIKNRWYVSCVIDVDAAEPITPKGVLGIDLGIVNIASDNMGQSFSGTQIEKVRNRYAKHRAVLQRTGTKAAKRHLKSMSGKQKRFQKITNHTISKAIVSKAERLHFSIAVEDLTGIRSNAKAKRAHRNKLHNWSFFDLRSKIEYKAMRVGIPCVVVDPRNTSRECPECGYTAKSNRRTQSDFSCRSCGHKANADTVGAVNIAARGCVVTSPMFAHERVPRAVESRLL